MKLIVAGGREFKNYDLLDHELRGFEGIEEIVSGRAPGADRLGEKWAEANSIPLALFPANWDLYRKSAGRRRNIEMAEYGDELIAFWDGRSTGTKHMISIMRTKNKPVKVVLYNDDNRV